MLSLKYSARNGFIVWQIDWNFENWALEWSKKVREIQGRKWSLSCWRCQEDSLWDECAILCVSRCLNDKKKQQQETLCQRTDIRHSNILGVYCAGTRKVHRRFGMNWNWEKRTFSHEYSFCSLLLPPICSCYWCGCPLCCEEQTRVNSCIQS